MGGEKKTKKAKKEEKKRKREEEGEAAPVADLSFLVGSGAKDSENDNDLASLFDSEKVAAWMVSFFFLFFFLGQDCPVLGDCEFGSSLKQSRRSRGS
jgi:hypothetical protein